MFVYLLTRQYGYLNGFDYLWRYSQGDSPLTPESVHMALTEPTGWSASLVDLAGQLRAVVTSYQAGEIEHTVLEQRVDGLTDEIRQLAKKIRKDQLLEFIDQRKDAKLEGYSKASSVEDLLALTDELNQLAVRIHDGLSGYSNQDVSRVISVDDLSEPSFDSMSKGVDRLAKVIKGSVDRL